MRKSEVSSTLTVYHDGQFWVGVVEHVENGMLSVARLVFGAEPSNEEVYTWVLERWSSLRLSAEAEPVGPRAGRLPGNPKRRARETAKAMHQRGPSTVSQLALARERERVKDESRSERAVRRQDEARSRWEGRCERKRRKHAANSRYSFGRALFLHLRSVGRMAPRSDAHSSTDQSMF